MALFITSKAQARRHGVFAMEKTPPATVKATGTGTVVLVEQFPWGPDEVLTYASDTATLINMIAPPGMDRTGSGYLSVIKKGFARFGFIRVIGATAAKAAATIASSTPTDVLTVTAKYKGTAGNAITWTIANASDGNTNHFNLTATVTGASGTTTETIANLNISGVGADVLPTTTNLNNLVLIGSVAKIATGRPANATGSFTGGTDGTVALADYAGTAGTADRGIALCESDKTIDFVCVGDPGNTLRATVNAALVAHADLMTDRMAVVNGPSGQTAAQAQTDVASYRSQRAIYVDAWVYINDDVDGTLRLVPPAPFAASVGSLLPPSTSIAWKSTTVRKMLSGITSLEANRGNNAADNTEQGIVTLIPEDTGGFTFESAKNTNYPADPARGSIKRTRMGHFIGRSVVSSLRPYTDAPNVPFNQQDQIEAVEEFLSGLKRAAALDPNNLTHIADFAMADTASLNPQASVDAGEFTIGANIKISSDEEKIYFMMNYGESVQPVATVQL